MGLASPDPPLHTYFCGHLYAGHAAGLALATIPL